MAETTFSMRALPRALAEPLLVGGVGKGHLMALCRVAQGLGDGAPRGLALDLALAAWEGDPLDGEAAAGVLALGRETLDAPLVRVLEQVAASWARPGDLKYYQRLLERKDPAKTMRYLEQQRDKEPSNLFWLQQAAGQCLYQGDPAGLDGWLAHPGHAAHAAPMAALRGGVALCSGDAGKAAREWGEAHQALGLPGFAACLAEALLRLGERDRAVDLLAGAVARRPWQVNALLRLHDLRAGLDRARALPDGPVAVLLYSFNKADSLDATLASLHASDLGGALVRVLDNGSTDHTPRVLDRWRERFGPERFGMVRLPLNVGAPAARNWLLSLPEVRESSYTAYLDDDALVEPDWLGRLGAAVAAYPDAGVWGVRILDGGNPALLQSVDLHLADPQPSPPPGGDQDKAFERRFGLSNLNHQVLDFGQFTYARPCASVTGCCHLFRTGTLLECGDFDLRFSPTQYDDLDHDLRLALMGRLPVYQGHLAVRHMKRTGKASHMDAAEFGNAFSNMYKLQFKHSAQDIQAVRDRDFQAMLEDFEAKAGTI